jgi:hypothetical protein
MKIFPVLAVIVDFLHYNRTQLVLLIGAILLLLCLLQVIRKP